MLELNKIYKGDCLTVMQGIDDKSVDMILCDLPYNTTPCKWDCMILFEPLWNAYKRIIKPEGAIVLFAQQPFTTKLISSNLEMWKYNWIWVKENGTNFLNSHYQPIKTTEDICVFGFGSTSPSASLHMTYNPQKKEGYEPYERTRGERTPTSVVRSNVKRCTTNSDGTRFPTNILYFKRDKEKLHPTAKPVDLMRYLIRTYTNDNNALVLDNCCGSGSTCVAAIREKRNFIGIELNDEYFDVASNRINSEMQQLTLF